MPFTTKLTKAEKDKQQNDAKMRLTGMFKKGQTVYTCLRQTSKSGMSRHITVHIAGLDQNGEPSILDISVWVARLLDRRRDKRHGGLKINGCGMDMGFAIVSEMSRALFNDDYYLNHRWI